MTLILLDVDDAALAEATRVFGTTTTDDTVNAALREGAARLRSARELAERAGHVPADENGGSGERA
ncbi:type II toxin-antitoxin system VapB family antitoxin [Micromonospora sp. NPDC051300]|uniref:type II toxin-antitoxin system VapB family antitoxin n=1 Tax=Micromonospora sp. NPDC051300 TaxID=3364286 RepID=UPI0037B2D87C